MMLPVKMEKDKINLCKEQSSMKYNINCEMDKICSAAGSTGSMAQDGAGL